MTAGANSGLRKGEQPLHQLSNVCSFESFVFSERGEEYEVNEDYAIAESNAGVFVIADGLGGRPKGELASRTAAETFLQHIALLPLPHRLDENSLQDAVSAANHEILRLANSDQMLTGMGTTLSAAVFAGARGKIVHIGDSRIYHYQHPELRALTHDHTVAADLLRQQQISSQTAARSPLRNMLSRCVGTNEHVKADIVSVDLNPNDLLVAVTDGVTKILNDAALKAILLCATNASPETVCRQIMCTAANSRLRDNATILIARLIS